MGSLNTLLIAVRSLSHSRKLLLYPLNYAVVFGEGGGDTHTFIFYIFYITVRFITYEIAVIINI